MEAGAAPGHACGAPPHVLGRTTAAAGRAGCELVIRHFILFHEAPRSDFVLLYVVCCMLSCLVLPLSCRVVLCYAVLRGSVLCCVCVCGVVWCGVLCCAAVAVLCCAVLCFVCVCVCVCAWPGPGSLGADWLGGPNAPSLLPVPTAPLAQSTRHRRCCTSSLIGSTSRWVVDVGLRQCSFFSDRVGVGTPCCTAAETPRGNKRGGRAAPANKQWQQE